MSKEKRTLDIVVLSDLHLGTYGCHAKEILNYLQSINPKKLILNGDIVDIWQFKKRYFPKEHLMVINHLLKLAEQGTEITYVTGNHDELIRKVSGLKLDKIEIVNKKELVLTNHRALIFHGDIFDVTMQYSKWLTKIGGTSYEWLVLLNRMVNKILVSLNKDRISLSKKIKSSVKKAVSYINDFEELCAKTALEKGFDTVICGHIHEPTIRELTINDKKITYLNSGDWIENLTSLEYSDNKWSIYSYFNQWAITEEQKVVSKIAHSHKKLFDELLEEFQIGQKVKA
ncbi:MAG: UDP-2,3-diacylglucosamine hydrolase [Bacteroidetes bacterium MED-G17]|nr:MAG: UDP-2,3-diacylglucosamine hydrolase [Bacteroidetes bacterium TMED39]PDH52382.1 MAG: UDP-2,3-diacylglucosamine hydrolase [Bacteroidetes bacterium MED-G17]CAI8263441.1 MAG: UDP-2,3-diacylglucosamine hydrolase [Bacteroidetes bacterium MED-G17]|tara:strand:+ start:8102 stop:8959 length:858 start_codon:yes stop_codon:yes gene_type:complete